MYTAIDSSEPAGLRRDPESGDLKQAGNSLGEAAVMSANNLKKP